MTEDISMCQYETDSITSREYCNLSGSEKINGQLVDLVDKNNFVLATYENTTRFLLQDGTLVIVKSNPESLYRTVLPEVVQEVSNNFISFYLHGAHAQIKVSSGASVQYYDLEGNVRKKDVFLSTSAHVFSNESEIGPPLILRLNGEQFDKVSSAINELSSNAKYKWAPVDQNCVRFLSDVSHKSLPYHFSYYLKDEELFKIGGYTGPMSFLQKSDNKHPSYYDPNKSLVLKSFGKKDYLTIKNDQFDIESNKSDILAKRYDDLKALRSDACPKIIGLYKGEFTEDDINSITKLCIDRSITNENMVYPYTYSFELKNLNRFEGKLYQYELVPRFGYEIDKSCNNFNSFQDSDAWQKICKSWCHNNNNKVCDNWNVRSAGEGSHDAHDGL